MAKKETSEQVFIKQTIEEARRFIEKARDCYRRLGQEEKLEYPAYQLRERAAMKRASMDLSRMLATLRK